MSENKLIRALRENDSYWLGRGPTWEAAEADALAHYDAWASIVREEYGNAEHTGILRAGEEEWDVFRRIERARDGSITRVVVLRASAPPLGAYDALSRCEYRFTNYKARHDAAVARLKSAAAGEP